MPEFQRMPKKPFAQTTIAAQAPSNAVGGKKHDLGAPNDGPKWPNWRGHPGCCTPVRQGGGGRRPVPTHLRRDSPINEEISGKIGKSTRFRPAGTGLARDWVNLALSRRFGRQGRADGLPAVTLETGSL